MFDRHGNTLSYPTEEAMLTILRGDQLDLENMRSIFKQAMMVDAASHGWNDAIDVMMDLGFSADDTDHKNYTPLGYAAMKGQTDTVVRLLFEYGADVTACNNFGPSMFDSNEWFEGYTALELALERNHFATAILLVRAGSSLEANILQMIYSNPEEHPVIDDFNYATKRPVEARLFELALERGKYSDAKGMVHYLEHTIKLIIFEHPRLQTILDVTEAHIAELNLQGDLDGPHDTLAYMDESFGAEFLLKRLDHLCHKRAARNWLKARKAVRKRWIVEYWRDCTARSHLERDRQVEVQAMAELMPPSLPPSPPGSEGDAANLSELAEDPLPRFDASACLRRLEAEAGFPSDRTAERMAERMERTAEYTEKTDAIHVTLVKALRHVQEYDSPLSECVGVEERMSVYTSIYEVGGPHWTRKEMYEWCDAVLGSAAGIIMKREHYDIFANFICLVFGNKYMASYVENLELPTLAQQSQIAWTAALSHRHCRTAQLKSAFDKLYFRCLRKAYAPGGNGQARDTQTWEGMQPPSLPPSPPVSEEDDDAPNASEIVAAFEFLPDQVLIDELDRVEGLRGKRLWSMVRDHVIAHSVVDYWMKLTGLIAMYGSSVADADSATSHAVRHAAFHRRSYEYGQRLLAMSESRSYHVGKDGAPNWPSPP